jgi:hypothetical protein
MRRFEAKIKGQPSLRRASGRRYYRRRGDRSSSQVVHKQTRHGGSVDGACSVQVLISAGFWRRSARMARIKSSTDSSSGQPPKSASKSSTGWTPWLSASVRTSTPSQKFEAGGELGRTCSNSDRTSTTTRSFSRGGSWRKSCNTLLALAAKVFTMPPPKPTALPLCSEDLSARHHEAIDECTATYTDAHIRPQRFDVGFRASALQLPLWSCRSADHHPVVSVHGAQLGHAARLVAAPTMPVVARSLLQEWFAALLPVLAAQSTGRLESLWLRVVTP